MWWHGEIPSEVGGALVTREVAPEASRSVLLFL